MCFHLILPRRVVCEKDGEWEEKPKEKFSYWIIYVIYIAKFEMKILSR